MENSSTVKMLRERSDNLTRSILGLLIVCIIGVTVMCCLFAAKEADDDMNTMSPSDFGGGGK